jgi:hypothetical protein
MDKTFLTQRVHWLGVIIMTISENVCHVCKTRNELEAIVCGQCGATLHDPFLDPGAKTKSSEMPAIVPEISRDWSVNAAAVPESGIAVYLEGQFDPAYIASQEEIIIGRKAEDTSEVSLDLAPFGAYHLGLSRRHAVLRRTQHGYEVLDLGSVNGTWLNDERLVPHQFYALPSGSHLRLGSMRLFVLYRLRAQPN